MHDDIIYLGPVPCEEDCTDIGDPDYARKGKAECRAHIEAIRKVCGREPPGARLSVKANQHDMGLYYETVVYFDGRNEKAAEYALRCESADPKTWEEAGMEAPDLSAGLRR